VFEIGGSKIDEHYGDWLNIWNELARNSSLDRGYDKMVGNVDELRKMDNNKGKYTMYVPMQFWFCRNNGLALPLIALQYHDVRVTFKFRDARECMNGAARSDVKFKDAILLIDYIYLDSEERKRFAQASHEYLIEQLQFTGDESVNTASEKFRLNFNHPCKALYWALKLGNYTTGKETVALNANGEIDLERFAKVVYLATRTNLDATGTSVTVAGAGVNAGDEILLARDTAEMAMYFDSCFSNFHHVLLATSSISQNGDDAIELFKNGNVVETFGDILLVAKRTWWKFEKHESKYIAISAVSLANKISSPAFTPAPATVTLVPVASKLVLVAKYTTLANLSKSISPLALRATVSLPVV
jgi:hypothetical protein